MEVRGFWVIYAKWPSFVVPLAIATTERLSVTLQNVAHPSLLVSLVSHHRRIRNRRMATLRPVAGFDADQLCVSKSHRCS